MSKHALRRSTYNKSFYTKCLEKGVCPRCGVNPPQPERRLCKACVDHTTANAKQRIAKYRLAGLCMCGNRPVEGCRLCVRCQERSARGRLASGTKQAVWLRNKIKLLRKKVFDAYNNKCNCCGETHEVFLQLDHVHNNGAEHKRAVGRDQLAILNSVLDLGCPPDFQILCANCHLAKTMGVECPHLEEQDVLKAA
jgi:hypothetical protein